MNQVIARSQTVASIRLVIFSIAGYRLGLPLDNILRVVNAPDELQARTRVAELSRSAELLELLPLGEHTLSVLNLRAHLSLGQEQASRARSQAEFLVVTKVGAELWAIRVDSPPDLIEVDAATIRQLPAPYRQGHPLSIASHVVVLPQGKATLAIFLLEMKKALAIISSLQNA